MSKSASRPLGPIAVADGMCTILAELRHRSRSEHEPNLDADRLHEVEAAVAMHFHDDLLATFAANATVLVEDWQLKITKVLGHTGALAARKVRGDLLALGERQGQFVCVAKRHYSDARTRVLLIDPIAQTESEPQLLDDWLQSLVDSLPEVEGEPASFEPALWRKPLGSSSGRMARHKKFGDGRVLTENGEGPTRKVKVDFPKYGLKLLQARFLEFLD